MPEQNLQPGIETVDIVGTVEMLLERAGFQRGQGFPISGQDVLRVLRALDYAPPENLLPYLATTGQVDLPPSGEFMPEHVVSTIAFCEAYRLWCIAPDSIHWNKLPIFARTIYLKKIKGEYSEVQQVASRYAFQHLLLDLMRHPDPLFREHTLTMLFAKLDALGVPRW